MYKHMNIILDKRSRGQPVSFTDFFGYLVGETILKDVSFIKTQIPTLWNKPRHQCQLGAQIQDGISTKLDGHTTFDLKLKDVSPKQEIKSFFIKETSI